MHRHRIPFFSVIAVLVLASQIGVTQQPPKASVPGPAPHAKQTHLRHVLVIGEAKGFEHDSISAAMNAIYEMGKETGLWDTMIRTDTELITKKDLGRNSKNLNYFDVLVFASTTGELDMDASQKQDMMSFIKDDGKGFVGIHAALDTNYNWPEYGEMIGGWFDQHPWMTFNAPIINEDPDFPAVRHFPKAFVKYDEIYQPKDLVARQGECAAQPRSIQARLQQQSAYSSDRPRFRRCMEQDVRQEAASFTPRWAIPKSRGKTPISARCTSKP